MLYQFKCKATGNLIMFEQDAVQLLRVIGKEPAAQGIIEADALPAAIHAIEAAMADDDLVLKTVHDQAQAAGLDRPRSDHLSLRQRAWPFMNMLRRAQAESRLIVWGV